MKELFAACGMQYVFDRSAPVSPFGEALVRSLQPYTSQAELSAERERLRVLLSYGNTAQLIRRLQLHLMQLKDIQGSLHACEEGGVLSLIELFELKLLLLHLQELKADYDALCKLPGVEFLPVEEALSTLDPFGRKRQTFMLDDAATPALLNIRREKAAADAELLGCADAKRRTEIRLRRTQLCEEERKEEQRIRADLSAALAPHCKAVLSCCEAAGHLDWLLQKAEMVHRFGAVIPQTNDSRIIMEGMFHPELSSYTEQRGEHFVPLNITLPYGTTLIAGANMGGKSVALRTLMLNLLLAMTGCPVFAKHAELPMLTSLSMLFGDAENEAAGLSAFGGEVERLRDALQAFNENGVLVLDEPARGTNPEEGAALVQSIAEYMNKKRGFTVIASHYSGVSACAAAVYKAGGLRADARQALQKLSDKTRLNADHIAAQMCYGLTPAAAAEAETGAALTVCRLLGLPDELMDLADEKMNGN